jgi:hypothetical protein
MQFLKGQEICRIAFGMYDPQINWGNGGLSCTGRVVFEPSTGEKIVWTEGHPFVAVPLLHLLQKTIAGLIVPLRVYSHCNSRTVIG